MDVFKFGFVALFANSLLSLSLAQSGPDFISCKIDAGLKGEKGDRGHPGPPGICECKPTDNSENERGDSASRPSKTTCSNVPASDPKPQWMGENELESFKIECDEAENMTCIAHETFSQKSILVKKNFTMQKQSFWWSTFADHSLKNMYGLRSTQIMWLHRLANSASQVIRIRGLDIKASSPEIIQSIVQLLTWNDVAIGFYPTSKSLFHYGVELPTSCTEKNSTTEPCEYVDIIMKTDMVGRLPITDIYFKVNLMEKDLKISVENIKLCFN
ncbi:uncharacterized protein LOC114247929 [Bombyx mandarina]|uniref:Uncharacterized protein LOC114247929 n=1 Tax=Bombyx mandarina TaxID=7092 RepID=A0A6J2K4D9_BOMMA|nr:uncharacterized protein LOC114247929 [Bombyx mandarina]